MPSGPPPLLTQIENATRVVLVGLVVYLVAGWLRPGVVDVWQWTRQHTSRARVVEPRMTGPVRPSSSVPVPH